MRLVGLAAVAALALSAQQPLSFAVRVDVVHLDVFVSRGNTPVLGLGSTDFRVFDNGVLQKAEVVSREDAPVHAILLLDTSSSVAGRTFRQLKAAAQSFLGGLEQRDRATLLSFAYGIELTSGPAAPARAVSAALARATASGATALHDAVFVALKLADPSHGRPVIVIFSDGVDRLSVLSAEEVLQVALESEATVYVVFLAAATPDPNARGGRSRASVSDFLQDLTRQTGGYVLEASTPDELGERFLEILSQVKSRYVLRFQPEGVPTGGWHEIEVQVDGRGAEIRSRKGYFRPPDGE